MGKVVVTTVADAPLQAFNACAGITAQGSVKSRAVITGSDRPLWLLQHEFEPGASVTAEAPQVEHLFYVVDGAVESTDSTADATVNASDKGGKAAMTLPTASVVAVSRGARASIKAGSGGAKLLQFYSATGKHDTRAPGGRPHVHRLGPRGLFSGNHYRLGGPDTLWLESNCPDCELWLHNSNRGKYDVPVHAHTEDEIIFVTSGEIVVGRRSLGPGAALAVDANTPYSFKSGEQGLNFINFRATNPWIVMYKEGRVPGEPQSDRENWHKNHVDVVAAA